MSTDISRRALLAGVAGGLAMSATESSAEPAKTGFRYCLNTSTVRDKDGKSRPITDLIDIAAKAGYDAIEPWIMELDAHTATGGKLEDVGKRIRDAGLFVPDAIGFAEWIVEDNDRRAKGLEQAKRDMEKVAKIGGNHLAAPPVGATGGTSKRDDPKFTQPVIDLVAAADRYRALVDVGEKMGVTPIVEVWGFSKTLRRLGEALLVAVESGSARGCVLPDVYHLYKGGSDFAGLPMLSGSAIGIFHVNDYPKIERDKITDADRVYPGDGIAPLKDVFTALREIGYAGCLSLELFNRDYWKQDPNEVAKTGLTKLRATVFGVAPMARPRENPAPY
jgi:sugar phosphate isomerase/epimerase